MDDNKEMNNTVEVSVEETVKETVKETVEETVAETALNEEGTENSIIENVKPKKSVKKILAIVIPLAVLLIAGIIVIIYLANTHPIVGTWKCTKIDGQKAEDFLCDYEYTFKRDGSLEIKIPERITGDGKPRIINGTYEVTGEGADQALTLRYNKNIFIFSIESKTIDKTIKLNDSINHLSFYDDNKSLFDTNTAIWELERL